MLRVVDETFLVIRRGLQAITGAILPANIALWLIRLQTELDAAIPADVQFDEEQSADLYVTKYWLTSQILLVAAASGCLRSTSSNRTLTMLDPVGLTKDMLYVLRCIDAQTTKPRGAAVVSADIPCTHQADILGRARGSLILLLTLLALWLEILHNVFHI